MWNDVVYIITYNRNNLDTIYLTIGISLLNNWRCLFTSEHYIVIKTKDV